MKTFLLTEGGKKIGFGHITRCISLYEELQIKQLNPKFIVNGDASILNFLKNKKKHIFDWIQKNKKRDQLISNSNCVIIDSYLAKKSDYTAISKLTNQLICIDDDNRITYPPSIITNGSIHANTLPYKKISGSKYLLGSPYILLRKEFKKVKAKKINQKIGSIFITFGGTDLRNLTPRILALISHRYPHIKKNVVISSGLKKSSINRIKRNTDSITNIIFSPSAFQMIKYMKKSDIAISASGQTLNELACVGLPTIDILVIENQINIALGWQKRKFNINVGNWDNNKLEEYILEAIDKLSPGKERQKRSEIGQKYVDGRGPERIIKHIIR